MKKDKKNIVENEPQGLTRRRFLTKTLLGAGLFGSLYAGENITALGQSVNPKNPVKADKRFFRFAVISDTHVIDDFYKGPENSPLDTETIFQTNKRLTSVREYLNNQNPPLERVFVCGDFFHDYPSTEYDFYQQNRTRIDNAKELIDGFKMPVHVALGNHDYNVPKVSREVSHRLFKEKLKIEPYYSVTHRGYKFVILNNFLGETWNPESKDYNKAIGSFGETQLKWFEAQILEGLPVFVFLHFPLYNIKEFEFGEFGLGNLLKKYKDRIQVVFSGHWHRWFDFAKTFGPQHYTVASTRYDEDAYMLVEVDTKKKTYRIINHDSINWSTRYSEPYR